MPASFWIFLIVCLVSFIPVVRDHGKAWKELKEATGKNRCRKAAHFFALWFVAFFSLIGTLSLGRESFQSDKKDERRDAQYRVVTNDLQQVTLKYDEATNDLALTRQAATNAQSEAKAALKASQPKPFDERLRNFLNVADKSILTDLKNGKVLFSESWEMYKISELKELCDDPESPKFIRILPGGGGGVAIAGMSDGTIRSSVRFFLSPNLITNP